MMCHNFIIFLSILLVIIFIFFFFNDTATTEIYTLSLRDALPISPFTIPPTNQRSIADVLLENHVSWKSYNDRSEEHTSELQSRLHLVCRLLLEKKKTHYTNTIGCTT